MNPICDASYSRVCIFSENYYFSLGVSGLVDDFSRLYKHGDLAIVDFTRQNIQNLLPSKIRFLSDYDTCMLIADDFLYPLAISYRNQISSNFLVVRSVDVDFISLPEIKVYHLYNPAHHSFCHSFSLKDILFLENLLLGVSLKNISLNHAVSLKTVYHWRTILLNKFNVRKINDLL